MEQLRTVGNDAHFWQEMYEEASKRRRREHERAAHYQKRAQVAEKAVAKWRKAVILIGVFSAAWLNAIYWIWEIGGAR